MSGGGKSGPCGPLYDEIIEQEDILSQCLDEFPIGSTADPRAEANDVTLTELAEARDLIRQANDRLERAIEREAKYSANNGWTTPGRRPAPAGGERQRVFVVNRDKVITALEDARVRLFAVSGMVAVLKHCDDQGLADLEMQNYAEAMEIVLAPTYEALDNGIAALQGATDNVTPLKIDDRK